jgi:hypothetical protein
VLRDFLDSHPDFNEAVADDRGLVQATLGADRKPVYAPPGKTTTTSGVASFNQWYRETPGVNQSTPFTLHLSRRYQPALHVLRDDPALIIPSGSPTTAGPHPAS